MGHTRFAAAGEHPTGDAHSPHTRTAPCPANATGFTEKAAQALLLSVKLKPITLLAPSHILARRTAGFLW
jgi:hypothetical protein